VSGPEDAVTAALAAFKDALSRTENGLDGLEAPAKPEALAAAEKVLGLAFPPAWRRFLLTHNGGGAYETSIYGVGTDDGFDVAVLNLRAREDDLPEHLLAFAATVQGDVYCFDTQRAGEDGEAPVVLLDVEEGQLVPVAASFLEWLERLPRLETEVAESRGPQPMSIPEWEAFVLREREKLRRLSKTPARDLPMPDPERVRGDLGGKIPVDPRHLKPKT